MRNKGFVKLYRNMLSKAEVADLVNEEGAVGFGVCMMVVLYLSQCDDYEGAYTNGQLQILADQARKSRAYVRHIIEDFGLFRIKGKRFHDLFMNEYSHARKDRYAGEDKDIDIEKEKKEKGTKVTDKIGPSALERVDARGCRHGSHGELVPWWAPPQVDVYKRWSLVANCWVPLSQIDREAEKQQQQTMPQEDFLLKTAWEKTPESEHYKIQDDAKR